MLQNERRSQSEIEQLWSNPYLLLAMLVSFGLHFVMAIQASTGTATHLHSQSSSHLVVKTMSVKRTKNGVRFQRTLSWVVKCSLVIYDKGSRPRHFVPTNLSRLLPKTKQAKPHHPRGFMGGSAQKVEKWGPDIQLALVDD